MTSVLSINERTLVNVPTHRSLHPRCQGTLPRHKRVRTVNGESTSAAVSGRSCFVAAVSSVLAALMVLFLWKSGAINIGTAYVLAIVPVGLMIFAFVRSLRQSRSDSKASQRYLTRMALVMAFYLLTLFVAENQIDDRGLTGPLAALLALLPGLSFAGVIWIFGALIVEEQDEFFRLLYVRQGLIATGVSFTLAAVWGYLETYRIVDPVVAYWWPTIWCFGIAIGGVANKIKYGTFGEMR